MHTAIVGGGLLGMTLAHRLAQRGDRVTLLEASDRLGGLADAWELGDVTWDRHYHVTLLSDLHTRGIVEEIGLADEFEWVETKTGFYTDGKLHSMSNSLEFLRFPPLRLWDKLRLGLTIFQASKRTDWRALEKIPVEDWLRKWSGNRATERIWLPLLRSKLGEAYRETSAAFLWATIARMYAARRSGLKKEMFGYVRGGYDRVLKRFEEVLVHEGVDVRKSTPIRRVHGRVNDSVDVELADGAIANFDRVVMTVPSPLVPKLCPDIAADERERHAGLRYQGIVCASLLTKKPLDRFYVTNLTDDWVPFTGVIEMTALVDPAELSGEDGRGRHLVYLPKYVAPDDAILEESDESIRERFVSALERMYADFSRDDVEAFRVSRVPHVFPVPKIGYSDRLPPMRTSIPGLFAVNSAHIVNGTLNVNETIALAESFLANEFPMSPTVGPRAIPEPRHPLPLGEGEGRSTFPSP